MVPHTHQHPAMHASQPSIHLVYKWCFINELHTHTHTNTHAPHDTRLSINIMRMQLLLSIIWWQMIDTSYKLCSCSSSLFTLCSQSKKQKGCSIDRPIVTGKPHTFDATTHRHTHTYICVDIQMGICFVWQKQKKNICLKKCHRMSRTWEPTHLLTSLSAMMHQLFWSDGYCNVLCGMQLI